MITKSVGDIVMFVVLYPNNTVFSRLMYLDVLNNISSMSFFKTVALNTINWRPLILQLTLHEKSPEFSLIIG